MYIHVHTIETGYQRRYHQGNGKACHAFHDSIHVVGNDGSESVHCPCKDVAVDVYRVVRLFQFDNNILQQFQIKIVRVLEDVFQPSYHDFVSVCYHHTELIPDFIQHTRRKGIVVNNKLTLILRIIYSSAVWFLKYLKQINNDVATAEKELEKSIRNEDLLQLMKLQKTLVYFNTSIRGNEVMIGRLKNIFQDTDYLDLELLEDVVIELNHIKVTADNIADSNTMNTNACGNPSRCISTFIP